MRLAFAMIIMAGVLLLVILPAGTCGELVLTGLDGKKVPLDSLLARGPVVLNFWATWCMPCRIEMPHFEKVYENLAPKGVQFGAVSLDRNVPLSSIRQFLNDRGMAVPSFIDSDGSLARAFTVSAIPTTVVLETSGAVYYRAKGYRQGDEVMLRKKIEELLGKGQASVEASG